VAAELAANVLQGVSSSPHRAVSTPQWPLLSGGVPGGASRSTTDVHAAVWRRHSERPCTPGQRRAWSLASASTPRAGRWRCLSERAASRFRGWRRRAATPRGWPSGTTRSSAGRGSRVCRPAPTVTLVLESETSGSRPLSAPGGTSARSSVVHWQMSTVFFWALNGKLSTLAKHSCSEATRGAIGRCRRNPPASLLTYTMYLCTRLALAATLLLALSSVMVTSAGGCLSSPAAPCQHNVQVLSFFLVPMRRKPDDSCVCFSFLGG
jgi:hypothetical protein